MIFKIILNILILLCFYFLEKIEFFELKITKIFVIIYSFIFLFFFYFFFIFCRVLSFFRDKKDFDLKIIIDLYDYHTIVLVIVLLILIKKITLLKLKIMFLKTHYYLLSRKKIYSKNFHKLNKFPTKIEYYIFSKKDYISILMYILIFFEIYFNHGILSLSLKIIPYYGLYMFIYNIRIYFEQFDYNMDKVIYNFQYYNIHNLRAIDFLIIQTYIKKKI